jgi:hypothetical protein
MIVRLTVALEVKPKTSSRSKKPASTDTSQIKPVQLVGAALSVCRLAFHWFRP